MYNQLIKLLSYGLLLFIIACFEVVTILFDPLRLPGEAPPILRMEGA
jgi:hypothetical protein